MKSSRTDWPRVSNEINRYRLSLLAVLSSVLTLFSAGFPYTVVRGPPTKAALCSCVAVWAERRSPTSNPETLLGHVTGDGVNPTPNLSDEMSRRKTGILLQKKRKRMLGKQKINSLPSKNAHTLYSFPSSAAINSHKLRGLKQEKFFLSEFWQPEMWTQGASRVTPPLKALGENPFLPLPASGSSWHSLTVAV